MGGSQPHSKLQFILSTGLQQAVQYKYKLYKTKQDGRLIR